MRATKNQMMLQAEDEYHRSKSATIFGNPRADVAERCVVSGYGVPINVFQYGAMAQDSVKISGHRNPFSSWGIQNSWQRRGMPMASMVPNQNAGPLPPGIFETPDGGIVVAPPLTGPHFL